jgi:dTDP-4-dehydrorhamnose reductase
MSARARSASTPRRRALLAREPRRPAGALAAALHSTDYVYDGSGQHPLARRIGHRPAPLSVYGLTKLEGDQAIRRQRAVAT